MRHAVVLRFPKEISLYIWLLFHFRYGGIHGTDSGSRNRIFMLRKKKNVPVGYIGAVQKLEIVDWPPANAEITMEINLITNILQVSLVSGIVKYQGKMIASCEMKIFVND